MKSLKIPSRIVTVIVTIIIALCTYVAAMSPEALGQALPGYEAFAPVLIVIAAAIVNAYSEEKRVQRAEQLAIEHNAVVQGNPIQEEVLNDEYVSDET